MPTFFQNAKNTHSSPGYTLIELLVVITIFTLLSVAAVAFFLTTILGNDKVNSGISVKQQGDYALTSMVYMIRNATAVTACAADHSSITILNRDGNSTTYTAPANSRIASTSATTNYLTSSELRVNPTDTTDPTLPPLGNLFTCLPNNTDPTAVTIRFILRKGTYGTTAARDITTQVFTTTVGLRRY